MSFYFKRCCITKLEKFAALARIHYTLLVQSPRQSSSTPQSGTVGILLALSYLSMHDHWSRGIAVCELFIFPTLSPHTKPQTFSFDSLYCDHSFRCTEKMSDHYNLHSFLSLFSLIHLFVYLFIYLFINKSTSRTRTHWLLSGITDTLTFSQKMLL